MDFAEAVLRFRDIHETFSSLCLGASVVQYFFARESLLFNGRSNSGWIPLNECLRRRLLPLPVFLQETVAFIFSACTLPAMLRIALQAGRAEKLTPHSLFGCCRVFSVSSCLKPGIPGGWLTIFWLIVECSPFGFVVQDDLCVKGRARPGGGKR